MSVIYGRALYVQNGKSRVHLGITLSTACHSGENHFQNPPQLDSEVNVLCCLLPCPERTSTTNQANLCGSSSLCGPCCPAAPRCSSICGPRCLPLVASSAADCCQIVLATSLALATLLHTPVEPYLRLTVAVLHCPRL
ncbi:hypothetical protein O6H91_05G091500 [Diphasiastrum complanatum]|uniref:Uncharacterized protein n=1 Tax=Diphasiastrum complanatum TaxID=34168 RepID=A0ACC2DQR2_DIPCM|nr:hypothetical protein O6H91_05G091500 [Diphasiastrum complanatum]